jgi:mannose-6-phosphate isomerase-like protein (cupin superfamily)
MTGYTHLNLKQDVEDMAPSFDQSPSMEARFARGPLELEQSGMTYFRLAPGFRVPFGHKHVDQEEVYVVVNGSARIKIDDEILDLSEWDAVRVPGDVVRNLEAGDEGAEVLAFGAPPTERSDSEMIPGWWSD